MMYVYLAGPAETEDTWRARAAELVAKIPGLEAINPLRGESIRKERNNMISDLDDKTIVRRDLNDLNKVRISGGVVVANLNRTSEGRDPVGTLFELMWAYAAGVPVIAITGNAAAHIKKHPWVRYCTAIEVSSLTAAVEKIEELFA